jgi:recombination protein RecA
VLKSGTWLSMKHPHEGEIRLGQGIEKARQFLIDNPEVAQEIDKALRAKTAESTAAKDEANEKAMATSQASQSASAAAEAKTLAAASRK